MRRLGLMAVTLVLAAAASPAGAAGPDAVKAAFTQLLGDPLILRVDARAGSAAGTYERINIYAKRGRISGLMVEDLWMLIRDVVADPERLERGKITIRSHGEAAIHAFVLPRGLEQAFQAGTVKDAKVSLDGEVLVASGTYLFLGLPSRLTVRGTLYATGRPEVFLNIARLVVGIVPMPPAVVGQIERDINPVINLRKWPVAFEIHSVKVARGGIMISTLGDAAGACGWCLDPTALEGGEGGKPAQATP